MSPSKICLALLLTTMFACKSDESSTEQSSSESKPTELEAKPTAPTSAASTSVSAAVIASIYKAELCTTVDPTRMAKALGLPEGTKVEVEAGVVSVQKFCRYRWGKDQRKSEDEKDTRPSVSVSYSLSLQGHADDVTRALAGLRSDARYAEIQLPGHAAFWNANAFLLLYYPDAEHSLNIGVALAELPDPKKAAISIVTTFL